MGMYEYMCVHIWGVCVHVTVYTFLCAYECVHVHMCY